MMDSNFHSHCTFCDGRSHPEDFVKFAVARGFRAYGFSSHAPLPFETSWNMTRDDMPEYLAEIDRLKKKYEGRIELYVGLEIDYLDETYHAAIPFFQELPLDYRIGSLHYLPWQKPLAEANMVCIDGPYEDFRASVDTHYGGDIGRLTTDFFETSMRMVETGGFDVVGHIDKVYMNGCRYPGFDRNTDRYRKPFLSLLDLIAEKGLIVEVNSKNVKRKGQTYPHADTYRALKERNIPVMVNSDCHFPDLVNDGRNQTIKLLRTVGFRTLRELVKGAWTDVPID